jgi:hypothetical protein
MIAEVGETLRSLLTGRVYQLKRVLNGFAVLEGEDPFNRVYTEIGNLASFYEQVEIERDRGGLSLSPSLDSRSHGVDPGITRRE